MEDERQKVRGPSTLNTSQVEEIVTQCIVKFNMAKLIGRYALLVYSAQFGEEKIP
jgi:hypothetical protein